MSGTFGSGGVRSRRACVYAQGKPVLARLVVRKGFVASGHVAARRLLATKYDSNCAEKSRLLTPSWLRDLALSVRRVRPSGTAYSLVERGT